MDEKQLIDFRRFIKHSTSHHWWQPEVQGKSNEQIFAEMKNRPVCPKCEKLAMRHTNKRAKCPHCHWEGQTITMDELIYNEMHRR